jgi:hypothetical protein
MLAVLFHLFLRWLLKSNECVCYLYLSSSILHRHIYPLREIFLLNIVIKNRVCVTKQFIFRMGT